MDQQPQIPIDKTIRDWATITVDKFQEQLVKLNVGEVDGNLMRSFKTELQLSGGDAMHVIIKFLAYGRMVDMGVGRGRRVGEGNSQMIGGHHYGKSDNFRRPKKWYSKIKTREVAVLRFILAKRYSILALKSLESELKAINTK